MSELQLSQAAENLCIIVSITKINNLDTSRRDDLLSLFYLLEFLVQGSLPWIPKQSDNQREVMSFEDFFFFDNLMKKNFEQEVLNG